MSMREKFTDEELRKAYNASKRNAPRRAGEPTMAAEVAARLSKLGRGPVTRHAARHWIAPLRAVDEADAKKSEEDARPIAAGIVTAPDMSRSYQPGARFILTVAQNNTRVHETFFQGLETYAKAIGASILVSRQTYNKNGFQNSTKETDDLWYDPAVLPYICDHPTVLGNSPIVFAGELDILPTAIRPTSGFDNYARGLNLIIPHNKVEMTSVPTAKSEPANFVWTTGTCTLRNYIPRKAGQVASFHHSYGALLVECDPLDGGRWFVRQLLAGADGVFYDLDLKVSGSQITTGERPEAVTLGDIHVGCPDLRNYATAAAMLYGLQPKSVFIHDLLQFGPRGHHDIKSRSRRLEAYLSGREDISAELRAANRFLWNVAHATSGQSANIVVVRSNHDEALDKWMDETHPVDSDPVNAKLWLELWTRKIATLEQGEQFIALRSAVLQAGRPGPWTTRVQFADADDSFMVEGVEHGNHGHYGPNGARGTMQAMTKVGDKMTIGHVHSAGIRNGVWAVGVLGSNDMGYNKGPSAWSPTCAITHANGKRQMITFNRGSWHINSGSTPEHPSW